MSNSAPVPSPAVELSVSAVRAWLEAQAPDAVVDRYGESTTGARACDCLLANFLRSNGAPRPVVRASSFSLDADEARDNERGFECLDEGLAEFVWTLDQERVMHGRSWTLTASAALAILDEVSR